MFRLLVRSPDQSLGSPFESEKPFSLLVAMIKIIEICDKKTVTEQPGALFRQALQQREKRHLAANQLWEPIGGRFLVWINLQRKSCFVKRPLQRDFLGLQRAKIAIWPRNGFSEGFAVDSYPVLVVAGKIMVSLEPTPPPA